MQSLLKKRNNKSGKVDSHKIDEESGVFVHQHSAPATDESTSRASSFTICLLILFNILLWGKITHRHAPETVDAVLKTVGTDSDQVYEILKQYGETATQAYNGLFGYADDSTAGATSMETTPEKKPEGPVVPEPTGNETSVVMTHVGIPTVAKLQSSIDSLKFLKGLSPDAPIYVSMEKAKEGDAMNSLKSSFANQPRVHFVASGNTLGHVWTMREGVMLGKDRKYVYAIYVGNRFVKEIDHINMVKTMEQYPDRLRNIRFRNGQGNNDMCMGPMKYNGLSFFGTATYHDGAQFTTFAFLDHILNAIGQVPRDIAGPMKKAVDSDCLQWGQTWYDEMEGEQYIA